MEYEKLLNSISSIINKYEEIAKITGENFNIFSILGMESSEVKTHSAFLGELLNPKGTHGLGDIPLTLFISQIEETFLDESTDLDESTKKEIYEKFQINTVQSQTLIEEHIGKINEEGDVGGRIDIVIKDNNGKAIVIENKIYASEGRNQLLRYHNAYPNALILFLTLDGIDAKSKGKLKRNEHYFCISYEKHIKNWLELCVKEAVNHPMLREALNQYIYLIKKLTHQTTNNNMKQEIIDLILKNEDNFKRAKVLFNNFNAAQIKLIKEFLEEVTKQIETKLGDENFTITIREDLNNPWSGFYVRHEKWIENTQIKLEGHPRILQDKSIYGIIAPKDKVDRDTIKGKLEGISILQSGFSETNTFPYYKTILEFDKEDEMAKLFDTEKREELIKNVADKVSELAKSCKEVLNKTNFFS